VLADKRNKYAAVKPFWNAMETLLSRIRSICEQNYFENFDVLLAEIEERLSSLAESVPELDDITAKKSKRRVKELLFPRGDCIGELKAIARFGYVYVFARFTLGPRLLGPRLVRELSPRR
jgi:hypothetical protein